MPNPYDPTFGGTFQHHAARAPGIFCMVIWYWFPTLIWVALVLGASSDMVSSQHTGPIVLTLLTWLLGTVDPRTFAVFHLLIRKSAHFNEYAVLSALWFRTLRGPIRGIWQWRWLILAVLATLVVAILDEWHQAFVPSRTSSGKDVVLDFCGLAFEELGD
jgi:VanZ family protein